MDDLELRRRILRHFAETGRAPDHEVLVRWGIGDARTALQRLHESHAVVLDSGGRILMANPFSGLPTAWQVHADHRRWFANCAWDAIAIPIALGLDAAIDAPWMDDGSEVELAIVDVQVIGGPGFVHFEVPAARWWDDIVHT